MAVASTTCPDEIRRCVAAKLAIFHIRHLNPSITIGRQITGPSSQHLNVSEVGTDPAIALLQEVGIPAPTGVSIHHHQFFGWQVKRVVISLRWLPIQN